jgi:hypothetical protein
MEKRKATLTYGDQEFSAFGGAVVVGMIAVIGSLVTLITVWKVDPCQAFMWSLLPGLPATFGWYSISRPRFFKCPQCGTKLGSKDQLGTSDEEPIRFVCSRCQIEWETGLTVPGGG